MYTYVRMCNTAGELSISITTIHIFENVNQRSAFRNAVFHFPVISETLPQSDDACGSQ